MPDRDDLIGGPDEGDVALACAGLVIDELVAAGMRHACVSPGSRSTPLALALSRRSELSVHVHLDERAAAFTALGIAKASGVPVAVACTSGTAAAELFPAVVEASQSEIPLILLTADRPLELRGSAANQTIDQFDLFGGYATFLQPRSPGRNDDVAREWRRAGRVAAIAALGRGDRTAGRAGAPGPVQVNCPFRERLTPSGADPGVAAPTLSDDGDDPREMTDYRRAVSRAAMDLGQALGSGRSMILAGGSRPVQGLSELASGLGVPLIAEPTTGARIPGAATLAAGAHLLSARMPDGFEPEVVVQVGPPPTARASRALTERAETLVVLDRSHLRPDPVREADLRLSVEPADVIAALADDAPEAVDPGWLPRWRAADDAARTAIDLLIDGWDEPFEGRIARQVAAFVPDGGTLVCGSSMPIRDLDAFMTPRTGLRVLANRGASGIDGFLATAIGVATADAAMTTSALCGDLTFLYDLGALAWSARAGAPDLVLVVVNNDGGAIFSFLDQAALPEHEQLFTTPHGTDLAAICEALGIRHEPVRRASALVPALERAAEGNGIRVVEVHVDRELNVARHREVQGAVDHALHGVRGT